VEGQQWVGDITKRKKAIGVVSHVAGYEASGQTREAYSATHGIKIYQLDYWRWKFKRKSAVIGLQKCRIQPERYTTFFKPKLVAASAIRGA